MAARGSRRARPSGIGIALAGGGPLGGIYEIGALAALADSLEGINLNELGIYVGVSSGSFVAAGLANGITPLEMVHMFRPSVRSRSMRTTAALDAAARLADGLDDLEHWLRVHALGPA